MPASGAQVAVQCSDGDGALAVRALLNALGKTGERPLCSTPTTLPVALRARVTAEFGLATGTRGVGAIWALGRMLDDQMYRWQDYACERQHARLLQTRPSSCAHTDACGVRE